MRSALMAVFLASTFAIPVQAQILAKKFKVQASSDTNAIVPDFFLNRDFVPMKYLAASGGDLTWFPGRVIYKDGNGDWVFLPVVTKGKATWAVKVAAVPYSFHSKINREYKGSFNVPAIEISAKMANAYDYEILDIATINVPDENVPDQQAVEAAVAARSLPAAVPVFWVASVTLTTVSVKTAAEIQNGGTITGIGFSTGASTYNASSAASFTPLASLGTIPMNAAAVNLTLQNKKNPPTSESRVVDKSFDKGFDTDAMKFQSKYESKLTAGGGIISRIKPVEN